MEMPKRIGGPKEGKPGMSLTVVSMPKRIGGPKDEGEEEGAGELMSDAEAKRKAAKEVLAAIQEGSVERLNNALTAFVHAADAEPHEEGEHTEDEGSEYEGGE